MKGTSIQVTHHITREFGWELSLAVWQSAFAIAKLKSANIFAMAIWDPTAEFYISGYIVDNYNGRTDTRKYHEFITKYCYEFIA